MSAVTSEKTLEQYQKICAFLYKEARHLDERQWEEWLEMYALEAQYWMPAWDDDDKLTQDPQKEISLIYYPNKNGLEDRVFRIQTERSSASMPEPRTSHQLTNIEVLSSDGENIKIRYNFHTLSHRYKVTDTYFGTVYATLKAAGDSYLFTDKKIILKNDYIRQVVDIYHI